MQFDSALELQARIFARIFEYEPLAPPPEKKTAPPPELLVDPLALEPGKGVDREKHRIVRDIALGVVEADRPRGGVKLAILVQDRRKTRCALVDEIRAAARDEAEVIYIGRQRPLWTRTRVAPLRMGASVSLTTTVTAGTLGAFCRGVPDGREGILSNNHVLAEANRAEPGTGVVQPGRYDGGSAEGDVIATLARFVPIQFGGIPNAVDAAVAELAGHDRGEDRAGILNCAEPPSPVLELEPELAPIELGMTVHKTGRTTCHTTGRVRAVNVNNFLVDYRGAGTARFDGQILIEMAMSPALPFSRAGDSGSLIVDDRGRPAALLFAGSESGGAGNLGITGANPISTVLAQLGIELI